MPAVSMGLVLVLTLAMELTHSSLAGFVAQKAPALAHQKMMTRAEGGRRRDSCKRFRIKCPEDTRITKDMRTLLLLVMGLERPEQSMGLLMSQRRKEYEEDSQHVAGRLEGEAGSTNHSVQTKFKLYLLFR